MVYNKISSGEYKKILELTPVCCIEVMIYHKGKVLLVLRKSEPLKNEWWFPGGRIYKNETLQQAAVRKAYEEAGIKVKIIKKIGAYETIYKFGPFDKLKSGVHTVNVCILAKPIGKNINVKIDKTSSKYRWIAKIEKDLLSQARVMEAARMSNKEGKIIKISEL